MSWPVLIVEDDPDIRELLVDFLAERGFEVLAATNGLDAMGLAAREGFRPTVILLDLRMPVMDGHEFLDRQHEAPLLDGVPVIVLTAQAQANRMTRQSARVRAVLAKPIPLSSLLTLIHEICGGSPRSGLGAPTFAEGSGTMDSIESPNGVPGREGAGPRRRRRSNPTRPLRLEPARSDATHAVLLEQVYALRAAQPAVLEHAVRIALAGPLLDVEVLSDEQLRDVLAAADDVTGTFR